MADAELTRFPDANDPELIARITVSGIGTPEPAAVRRQLAMALRCTDFGPFADLDVPEQTAQRLCVAAARHHARLELIASDGGRSAADVGRRPGLIALLHPEADSPASWLAVGEALSAVLLCATMDHLAASPAHGLWERSGGGKPAIAFRIGVPADRAAREEPRDRPATDTAVAAPDAT